MYLRIIQVCIDTHHQQKIWVSRIAEDICIHIYYYGFNNALGLVTYFKGSYGKDEDDGGSGTFTKRPLVQSN